MDGGSSKPLVSGSPSRPLQTPDLTHDKFFQPGKYLQTYEGNATRSQTPIRMDLVPAVGSLAIGARYGLGAIEHGESNWKSGGKEFIKSTVNHLEQHLLKLKGGLEPEDDHLGAIGWGATALAWFREVKPEEYKAAMEELR